MGVFLSTIDLALFSKVGISNTKVRWRYSASNGLLKIHTNANQPLHTCYEAQSGTDHFLEESIFQRRQQEIGSRNEEGVTAVSSKGCVLGLVSTRTVSSLPFPDSRAGAEMLLSTDVQGWGFLKALCVYLFMVLGISKTTRTPKVFLFPQVIFTDTYCIRKQNRKKKKENRKKIILDIY